MLACSFFLLADEVIEIDAQTVDVVLWVGSFEKEECGYADQKSGVESFKGRGKSYSLPHEP